MKYVVAFIFTKFLKFWKSNKPIPFYRQYKGQILNKPKAIQLISQTKTTWRSSETRTQWMKASGAKNKRNKSETAPREKRQALWGSKSRRNSNWEKTHSSSSVSAIDRTPNCITMQHSSCKIIVGPLFWDHRVFRYCGCIANLTFIYIFVALIWSFHCFHSYFIRSLTNSSFANNLFLHI